MTIRDVEILLEIPRATVRFYEKEGLIAPTREGNGYRDYSDDDVEKLKKIIILRKIGMPVDEINDLFDGVKSLDEALDANIEKLQMQMDELQGAMLLSRKMKEDTVQITSMDVNAYWKTIEEEEKKGNKFIDIAKDIFEIEKGVFASIFSVTDRDGKPFESFPRMFLNVVNVIVCIVIAGIFICLIESNWSAETFLEGIQGIVSIIIFEIIFEMVLSIPLYFLGKKYEWIRKNRKKALFITAVIILVVLLFLIAMLGA